VQGGHPELWNVLYNVTVTITNTGKVAGHEVAQLYLGVPNAPVKQLRGFERVGILQSGESREVEFALDRRDLSIWSVEAQDWELQRGTYKVWVGASSRDVKQEGEIVVQ
jgi:beta-glucosidase